MSSHHISPDAPQSVSKTGDVTSYDPDNPHMLELARNIAGDGTVAFYDLWAYTFIDVIFMELDQTGPYYRAPQYSINGGPRTDFDPGLDQTLYAPGVSYHRRRIENWPGGKLELYPPDSSDADRALIYGIIAHRGWHADLGVRWMNWARSGWSTQNWIDRIDNWQLKEPLKAIPGDLLHIGLGGNDIAQSTSISDMKQNYRDLIDWYHANVNADAPVLFTTMPWPDLNYPETSPPTIEAAWNDYMDAIVDVAGEYADSIVVDWRGFGRQSQNAELYLPGDEHWNNYGHRWIADVMSQQLRP